MKAGTSQTMDWSEGRWRNPPVSEAPTERGGLRVRAVEGSDAWQRTSYGFVHDSAHALLAPISPSQAIEVDFVLDLSDQFDQAGLMLWADSEHWVKAGVEYADGAPRVGAVVTDSYSDWSSAPVPEWAGRIVTVRASWGDDAVTIRAGATGEPLQFVRLAPFAASRGVQAGPYLCAPTHAGFDVEFTAWRLDAPDVSLH